jgi:hypothetical protein
MLIPQNKTSYILNTLKELRFTFYIIALTIIAIFQIRIQINKVSENIAGANKINTTISSYRTTYESLHSKVPGIILTRNILASALPPTEDSREFTELLNTFGKKHSLDIQTNVGDSQLETITYSNIPLRTLPITINVIGTLENIRNFIGDIEKVPYFFSIVSIDERGKDTTTQQRTTTIQSKLWTKPDQIITRMQSK